MQHIPYTADTDDGEFVEFGHFLAENPDLVTPPKATRWLRDTPERLPKTFKIGAKRFTTRGFIREWRANLIASAKANA